MAVVCQDDNVFNEVMRTTRSSWVRGQRNKYQVLKHIPGLQAYWLRLEGPGTFVLEAKSVCTEVPDCSASFSSLFTYSPTLDTCKACKYCYKKGSATIHLHYTSTREGSPSHCMCRSILGQWSGLGT